MEKLTLRMPAMYGDHHVTKVRQIITALPGVAQVQASAARQQIVVMFDPARLSADSIISALSSGGYPPGEAPGPSGPVAQGGDLRHVAATEQAEAVREAKYQTPQPFGVCPGLEPHVIAGEHPGDRR